MVFVPNVTFSIRRPCSSTAATRRLVPPRSTPIEKLDIRVGKQDRLHRCIQIDDFPAAAGSQKCSCFAEIMVQRDGATERLSSFLTIRAVMAAPATDYNTLDRRS